MRGRLHDPSVKSYAHAFVIGEPAYGFGVGVVVRSENPAFKTGDDVYGILEHQHYIIKNVLRIKEGLRLWLGRNFRKLNLAKRCSCQLERDQSDHGLKVIGSAGSEEKVQFMKEIGADVAFNYKTTKTAEVLEKEGPIDVYWDNVGGATLDAALEAANKGARFIECGMISAYNTDGEPVYKLQ